MTAAKPAAGLPHRLSSQDAAFIYGESCHGPLHVGCITYFDGRIDYDEFVARGTAEDQFLKAATEVFAPRLDRNRPRQQKGPPTLGHRPDQS